jgi:hypothetical protein
MAWFFGDGWELYAASADAYVGGSYWDSGTGGNFTLVAGRFAGSRALQNSASGIWLTKSSGANESVHHFCLGFEQTAAISGTTLGFYIQLIDGTTNQCAVVFRSDGAILLTSGGPTGTVLATYTGAVAAPSIWNGFEIEVVVHNTAGSIAVRKNGNTSNDFSLGSLNTRGGTANNYANKISLGQQASISNHLIDDFLWRSDASSVAWAGDIRCYTRMPTSDASVQWTPSGSVVPMLNFPGSAGSTLTLGNTAKYLPFVAVCDGTIGSLSLNCTGAATANIKCSLYASGAGVPTTLLGNATTITNPATGTTTWTFSTPVAVTRGVTYYAGFCGDAASGTFGYNTSAPPGGYSPLAGASTNYAAFPPTTPSISGGGNNWQMTVNITPTPANAGFVADAMQDAAATYVSSSTVGQTDLYGIASIGVTPASVIGVTTRALAQKTDAGTRNIGVQLKSGGTTSNGTSTALAVASWGWVWRNDLVDPATGAAWTATGVNNLQPGVTVTA